MEGEDTFAAALLGDGELGGADLLGFGAAGGLQFADADLDGLGWHDLVEAAWGGGAGAAGGAGGGGLDREKPTTQDRSAAPQPPPPSDARRWRCLDSHHPPNCTE